MTRRSGKARPRQDAAMLPVVEVPPHDEAAERAVIACALAVGGLVAEVPAAAFHSERLRNVWEAVLAVQGDGGTPDPYILIDRLKYAGRLALVGGEAAVLELADMPVAPSNAPAFGARILDAAAKREQLRRMNGAAKAAYDPTTTPEDVRQRLERAASVRPPVEIVVTTNVEEMADQAERALVASGRPLYHRGGELVRVVDIAGAPRIAPLPRASLVEDLSAVARWVRIRETKEGEETVPAKPDKDTVDALAARGRWALPELAAVVTRPVLRPDGTVLQAPGYDAASKILYQPACDFPPVPAAPTRDQARAALDALADLFHDFPFVERCDLSAALAFVLTMAGRHAIEGPCPLFLVRASTQGTGKNLVVDVVAELVLGEKPGRMSQGKRGSEEEEKRLLALGREGAELALIDNVERPLGSDVLAAALTSRTWRGRVLGQSATAEVPLPVFCATGNNVQVAGDLGRRVVPIDMVAPCESPEERSGFRHPHLLEHVKASRPALVVAALTVLRWFCAEGRPAADLRPFGSFERWSGLVRDALVYLAEPDPCAGRERIRQAGDPRTEAIRAAWRLWTEELGPGTLTVAQVVMKASQDMKLALAEATGLELSDLVTKLGYQLRTLKDRIVGGRRLERLGDRWRVVEVEPEDGPAEEQSDD